MEFIAFVSILILILFLTVYYNSSIYIQMNSAKIYNDAQTISDQAASEINLALKVGDGYSRVFYTPNRISNAFDYNITANDYLVILSWSGGSTHSVILTKNLTGSLAKGQNLIKNLNGSIYVNQ